MGASSYDLDSETDLKRVRVRTRIDVSLMRILGLGRVRPVFDPIRKIRAWLVGEVLGMSSRTTAISRAVDLRQAGIARPGLDCHPNSINRGDAWTCLTGRAGPFYLRRFQFSCSAWDGEYMR